MSWIINNLPSLIISIVSLIISIRSWYKTRVFYDVEVFELYNGNSFGFQNKELRDKLNTGKYTILNTYQDRVPVELEKLIYAVKDKSENFKTEEKVFIILGKIKK